MAWVRLYQFKKPDVNMAFPPLTWQTYDIQFTAPRWAADGSKLRNAHVTSWINGVKVQDNVALPNKTGAGKQEEPLLLPTKIQNHGDPVRFRNIWVVDRGLTVSKFPVYPPQETASPRRKYPRKQSPRKQSPRKQSPRKQNPRKQNPRKQNPRKQNPRKQNPRKQNPRRAPQTGPGKEAGGEKAEPQP